MAIELTTDISVQSAAVAGDDDLLLQWTEEVLASSNTAANTQGTSELTADGLTSTVTATARADTDEETAEARPLLTVVETPPVTIARRHWATPWFKTGALVTADLLSLTIAFVVGLAVMGAVFNTPDNSLSSVSHLAGDALVLAIFVVNTVLWFALYGLYRQHRRRLRPHAIADVGRLFHAMTAGTLVTLGLGASLQRVDGIPKIVPIQLVGVGVIALLIVPLGRATCQALWHGRPSARARVLIVGSGLMADQVRRHCIASLDLEVVGLVDDDPVEGTKIVGRIADLPRLCQELAIERIVVSFSRSHPASTLDQLRAIHGTVPISVVPRYFELLSWRSQLDDFDGLPVIDVPPDSLSFGARFSKRTFDVIGASLGLLVLAPVIAVVAVIIKCSSRGPVLFAQERVGKDQKLFTVFKFRTMRVGSQSERHLFATLNQSDGVLFKIKDDPRVFAVGRFLRRFSLDEIPQLLNVLLGQMSLVGPRPFVPEEAELLDGWAARRFNVRPGMTGVWQVSGRNDLSAAELCRLDYVYVASWSFWWDLRILWSTPSVIFRALGAY